jgi:hypothetical protein
MFHNSARFHGYFFRNTCLILVVLGLVVPVRPIVLPAAASRDYIDKNAAVKLTFHKVVNGQESAALDLTDPRLEFLTGDLVKVWYEAPFYSYVYIVNFSNAGGTKLQYPRRQEQNAVIPANNRKPFHFRLNNKENVPGTIYEDLIFIISRTKIENPTLNSLLNASESLDQLNTTIRQSGQAPSPQQVAQQRELAKRAELPAPPPAVLSPAPQQQTTTTGKVLKVLGKIGCTALSMWLGGTLNVICGLFSADYVDVEEDSSYTIKASPAQATEKMFMRLTFQHEAP